MMTPEQAVAHLTSTDPRFALTEADINGVSYRVFANAPASLRELLEQAGPAYDGRDALVYQDERWNHAQLCEEVKRLANALASELGVKPGEPVAMAMRNYPELLILILAVSALGAVAVPMNAWWSTEELEYGFKDSGARIAFVDGERQQRVAPFAGKLGLTLVAVRDAQAELRYDDLRQAGDGNAWPDVTIDTDDDFAIIYSSGSTGNPKGVVLTHRGAITSVYSRVMASQLGPLIMDPPPPPPPEDLSALVITPLFHVTALHALAFNGLTIGCTLVLMYKWDAEEAVRIIERENITHFTGVPTQSADLMAAAERMGAKLSSLRTIAAGGAKRPAAQVDELAEAFPEAAIASGWGMTETNSLGITLVGPDYLAHPEAAGRPTPPVQDFRIVDNDGQDVATGEVGELIVKSPTNMRCYHNLPEETADTLRDGWLYTGDLARQDEEGLFYIVDRKKSIILRGGENISCLEVEGVLHRHAAVLEAGVFPIPDQRLGETVGACVYLYPDSDVNEVELKYFVRMHLANFKVPEHIWLRYTPLPRGGTDKIDRRALRTECLADLATTETDHATTP